MSRSAVLAAGLIVSTHLLHPNEPPKGKPELYPAHASLAAMTLAAEYTGSSVFGRAETYYLRGFLVIDAAVFPHPRQVPRLASNHFRLRVNDNKTLDAHSPGMVALTVHDPAWGGGRRLETGGAIGPIVIGEPRRAPMPNDPRGTDPRQPGPVPRPVENEDRSGVERQPRETMPDVVKGEALLEGGIEQPARGYLYFPYTGKLKSVKKLELLYDNGSAKGALQIPVHP
jgi:hypothetical protein